MSDRIICHYLIETGTDVARACAIMAGEQSSGTFVPIPGETPELIERAAARVENIEFVESVGAPSLPGAVRSSDGNYRRARVTLSWPLANIGPSLPNLVATIAGNLFELQAFSGLRLLDFQLPDSFLAHYSGPAFAVAGTRRLSGVARGPLIGTIIKPSVGLSAEDTAKLAATLAEGGIDFIKDDELQSDGPSCRFEDRARAVMATLKRHQDRTGKAVIFAFNLTGDLDQMRRRHDLVLALGGNCVMASLNSVGLVGMLELRRHAQLIIHGHRNGWGYLTRHPALGWSYVAWQKLWRIAGVDHLHVNGLRNKFCEDDESVLQSARTCLTPLSSTNPFTVMPVFSSGQTVHQVPGTLQGLGSADLIYAAGGGVMAHPDGPAAGVRSLREAWEAAEAGIALNEHAKTHPALAASLSAFRA